MFLLSGPVLAGKQTAPAPGMSKQQAMNIAQQRHPGRVLAIKQQGQGYRVRIIDDNGEVHTLFISSQTGGVKRR